MNGLRVVHPGTHSTIQDRGRPGFRSLGVPAEGPFDLPAHMIANALVGNYGDAATIEMTLFGGCYQAESPLALALAGAPMETTIESPNSPDRSIVVPCAFSLLPGDRLKIRGCERGVRSYLATSGGFLTDQILNSRSRSEPLRAGEFLLAQASATFLHRLAIPSGKESDRVRVLSGPDAEHCGLDHWLGRSWRVGRLCDRVGVRLEGMERIPTSLQSDAASVPVMPGTVQVAGGHPLILGPSCGTMGGYPVAAVVISADLAKVGQLRPGDSFRFSLVDLDEARRLDREDRERLDAFCDLVRRRVLSPRGAGVGE